MFSTQNVKMYASILTDYLSCISPTSVAGGSGVARGAMGAVAPPTLRFGLLFSFFRRRKKGKRKVEKGKCFPRNFH